MSSNPLKRASHRVCNSRQPNRHVGHCSAKPKLLNVATFEITNVKPNLKEIPMPLKTVQRFTRTLFCVVAVLSLPAQAQFSVSAGADYSSEGLAESPKPVELTAA